MTNTGTRNYGTPDPAKAYELAYGNHQLALEKAAEYEARGWTYMAKLARNEARGYKATMTRIARRAGWIA